LELFCFGPPSARLAGAEPPPDVLWRKHIALLIYLGLTPNHTRTRDHLVGVFWPEKAEERARHSLNEALRRLRQSLGAARFISGTDIITLSAENLEVDAVEFERTVSTDPTRAASLLRGEFLEGFTLSDAPEFDQWALRERRRFHEKGAPVFVAEAERFLAASRFADAQDCARQALALHAYCEPAVGVLMRTLALDGDPAGALAAYHEFSRSLQEDFGEGASRELQELSQRIRDQRWRRTPEGPKIAEPPLVGRRAEHEATFRIVTTSVHAGPGTVLITGEPGMGKTRLINECVDRLMLDGASVAVARPLESDNDAPWSTLRALMRAGLLSTPGFAATDSNALAVLAAIVPELSDRVEPHQPQDRGQVASALAGLLSALADEQPIGIVIDDAHLADGSTLGALLGALSQLKQLPICALLAAQSSAQGMPRELLRMQSEIGRSVPGACIKLPPLAEEDVKDLIRTMATWCETDDERDRLTRRLVFETSGDPFLAVTLLRGLQQVDSLRENIEAWPRPRETLDTPLPIPMPNLVRMAIIARVTPLEADLQKILAAAAVCGPAIDLDLLAALTRLARADIEDQLPELERERFVVLDGERYRFTAPLIAQIIQGEFLTHGQRQTLRGRAVEFLGRRDDLESRLLRVELRARSDAGPAAFDEAHQVARDALAAHAYRSARRAARAAERALGAMEGPRREAFEALQQALP
jgi:DNA-binding SARP family transcriptional activator